MEYGEPDCALRLWVAINRNVGSAPGLGPGALMRFEQRLVPEFKRARSTVHGYLGRIGETIATGKCGYGLIEDVFAAALGIESHTLDDRAIADSQCFFSSKRLVTRGQPSRRSLCDINTRFFGSRLEEHAPERCLERAGGCLASPEITVRVEWLDSRYIQMNSSTVGDACIQISDNLDSGRIVLRDYTDTDCRGVDVAAAHESFDMNPGYATHPLDPELANQDAPFHVKVAPVTNELSFLRSDRAAVYQDANPQPRRYVRQLGRNVARPVEYASQVRPWVLGRVSLFARATDSQVAIGQRHNRFKVPGTVRRVRFFGNNPVVHFNLYESSPVLAHIPSRRP